MFQLRDHADRTINISVDVVVQEYHKTNTTVLVDLGVSYKESPIYLIDVLIRGVWYKCKYLFIHLN